ncbi:MAG: MaoC family dehydratase [Blastocatellia bacterium]|nr:MaoC family dehydratase [Blastocatellia bacterium]
MSEATSRIFTVGEHASVSKTITEADVVLFAGVTGDFNPVHLDAEFAKGTRFGARIAHGMLSAGLISAVLGMKLPGPGAIYLGQEIKFLKPVFIGDTITAQVEVLEFDAEKRRLTAKTECRNQRNEVVLTGTAKLLV